MWLMTGTAEIRTFESPFHLITDHAYSQTRTVGHNIIMPKMKFILPVIALLCASCATSSHGSLDLFRMRPASHWQESMVRGASFRSVPDSGILYMGFSPTGNTVAVTIGERKKSITAPMWYWSIDSSGAIVLSDYTGVRHATMELIKFKQNEVTVRNDREIIRYERTQK